MPHSQILASMAWIRCHAKTPAAYVCAFLCVSLFRFYAPLNHGPTPCRAVRLNHSRGVQETMPHCLCDKNITGYVRQRGSQSVFMNVRLCSDSVMVWWQHVNGIPVLPPHPFLSLKMCVCVCVLWRPEVVLWMAPGPDLAPNAPRPSYTPDYSQPRQYQTCASWCPGQRSCH